MALPAVSALELPRDPYVVPHPDLGGEGGVPVRPCHVLLKGLFLRETKKGLDSFQRDSALGAALAPPGHGR